MKVRLVLVSDTHGRHRQVSIPPGDVLIHAGDLLFFGDAGALGDFNSYLGELPHPHKVVIAGNHDFCFDAEPKAARSRLTNAVYLEDEELRVFGLKLYGSPWQPRFGDMAFNLDRGAPLREKWARIPADTDVLITHGPPFGHGDQTRQLEHVGCPDLLEAVRRVRPRLHVFGHIHEAAGTSLEGPTTFVNASVCDAAYRPANEPVVFDCEGSSG